ncbi:hypothetical protein AM493_04970 [Flavobacterium akiainvivens]|uniref:Uncharacterized protein n=1 Tax=Flavobacterium akiainvivens TaxID=1202724 RepID=A0A0M8MFY7_9FLAO|nr:DUF6766 family protein [Flavobacterium akiainvivens]KOS05451.1 hypothetical protein AM493_04970 [Flavobacterium akiainvivens]SFQ32295.1 hypothetical protein SAMN05444144_10327 [Flavobacterium akiainvivens]
MKRFLRNNGLSLAFFVLFILSIVGQIIFGFKEYNKELTQEGVTRVNLQEYLATGHFIESTFENWESEFLQMALFVALTIYLQQKGSSESKDFDREEEVDRKPDPNREGAPWPVTKGGWILKWYQNSLTLLLTVLFLLSFAAHFFGSLRDENMQALLKGLPQKSAFQYVSDSRFWFESFQNWQSEFLSVFAVIVLSIFFRQKGSSQSKPVDAPNFKTGE